MMKEYELYAGKIVDVKLGNEFFKTTITKIGKKNIHHTYTEGNIIKTNSVVFINSIITNRNEEVKLTGTKYNGYYKSCDEFILDGKRSRYTNSAGTHVSIELVFQEHDRNGKSWTWDNSLFIANLLNDRNKDNRPYCDILSDIEFRNRDFILEFIKDLKLMGWF